MRRRRLPFDEKAPTATRYAREDDTDRDRDVAGGKSAGMPRFLTVPSQISATEPDVDDLLGASADEDLEDDPAADASAESTALLEGLTASAIPDVSGVGRSSELTAYSVTLRGRTDASFSNSFRTHDVRTTPATGCDGCADRECVSVSGMLESTFRVTTRVTLPSVNDFPGLTACQRQRVRDGINNVLAPHEQQHVAAFQAYNGTIQTPFAFTLCRSEFNDRVRDLHDSIESARHDSAQAASDALDPFEFVVDLDCEG
jgi:hypothetical protein